MRGAGTAEMFEALHAAGGLTLRRQDVVDVKRGLRSDEIALLLGTSFEQDVAQAKAYLKSKE